jgi:hypothetical protein
VTTDTKRYVGTKTIDARPMTRAAYNDYRGWPLPPDENGDDAGFLVEYVDGGKANDSRHAGYISWSPADVFERSYKETATNFIQPKITGYRQLGPTEADLMNEAKALGAAFEDLVARLKVHHINQRTDANAAGLAEKSFVEADRLLNAEPERWLAMGRTDIQTGVMKIVRSIAQPAS